MVLVTDNAVYLLEVVVRNKKSVFQITTIGVREDVDNTHIDRKDVIVGEKKIGDTLSLSSTGRISIGNGIPQKNLKEVDPRPVEMF